MVSTINLLPKEIEKIGRHSTKIIIRLVGILDADINNTIYINERIERLELLLPIIITVIFVTYSII